VLFRSENISAAFRGRVFDILGEVFEESSLKDMLLDAVRYGSRDDVLARLTQRVSDAFDEEHIRDLLDRNALATETMEPSRLHAVKAEMEKAEARKLQPFFVRAFFMEAFEKLGGSIYGRELGRWEITHVPVELRERDRRLTGRNRRDAAPVLRAYERVCFEKEAVNSLGKLPAVMLHPGHPLMLAATDAIIDRHADLLRRGAVLADPADDGETPSVIFLLTHEVRAGAENRPLSRRLQFVRVSLDGQGVVSAGWAPHLDLRPVALDAAALHALVEAFPPGIEQRALAFAASTLAPEHYGEVAARHIAQAGKTLAAVHERLTAEISYWTDRYQKLEADKADGKDVRLNLENVRRSLNDLQGRLDLRKRELQAGKHVVSGTPVVLGGALVVPAGWLRRHGNGGGDDGGADGGGRVEGAGVFSQDAVGRARIERLAMDAVRRAEEAQGRVVEDVSAQKCGWDLTSRARGGEDVRHIEVKGRVSGAETVTVTRNEVLYALNQADKFVLALVFIGEDGVVDGPHYVKNPFTHEPDWNVVSINCKIADWLTHPIPD
jgi:hypothetical protein